MTDEPGDFIGPPEPFSTTNDGVNYAVYVTATGKIQAHGRCSAGSVALQAWGADYSAMVVSDEQYAVDLDKTSYILAGAVTPRGDIVTVTDYTVAADGVTEVSFAVPEGTIVSHLGTMTAIDDGEFTFTSDALGDFDFKFIGPAAYKDIKVTIHAV